MNKLLLDKKLCTTVLFTLPPRSFGLKPGFLIILVAALVSCMMPDLKSELYFSSTKVKLTEKGPIPTLKISWDGDSLSHNGAALTWLKNSGSLDLTAAITDPPGGAMVRWTIGGPANVVVFDGSTGTEKTVSADVPVTIRPGANFRTDTVTVTAALEGYSGVTASFTIEPGPHIVLYWDADRVDGGDEIRNGQITWLMSGPKPTKKAKAELYNAPAGFEYLQWTFGVDPDSDSDISDDNWLTFTDTEWHFSAQPNLSVMTIEAAGPEDADITVWNCDSTGTRGTVSSYFSLNVVRY